MTNEDRFAFLRTLDCPFEIKVQPTCEEKTEWFHNVTMQEEPDGTIILNFQPEDEERLRKTMQI